MSKEKKEICVGKDDVEIVDGKVVIRNEDMLEAIQSEQGVNLSQEDGQDSVSISITVTI